MTRQKNRDAQVLRIIIIEGSATGLIAELDQAGHALHKLWQKVKAADLVEGVCRACATKMGTLEAARSQKLALLDEMNGHPSMARFHRQGFGIITF